jgi:hypothetical protein
MPQAVSIGRKEKSLLCTSKPFRSLSEFALIFFLVLYTDLSQTATLHFSTVE